MTRCKLTLLMPLLLTSGPLSAEDGVPALLQFAEQYSHQHSVSPPVVVEKERRPSKIKNDNVIKVTPSAVKTQTERQQQKIRELERALSALRDAPPVEKAVDLSGLLQLIGGLRQAISLSPDERRMAELIRQASEETAREKQSAAMSLAQVRALKARITDLQAQQRVLLERASQAEAEQEKLARIQQRLRQDADALRERAKLLAAPQTLKTVTGQQSYAAGGALGRDILKMLDERKGWGIETDRQTLLAGVVDAFAGQYQLTTDVLAKALADSEARVNAARHQRMQHQSERDNAYIEAFTRGKGVKQSPDGFWFRVDYIGAGEIAANAQVDVVVKEMLTDGQVIQDMDLNDKVLSQPLKDYPPLFRAAIGQLKNHGAMTLVVPPELAYGEAGFPPKIPPNAAMVYELRVVDAKTP
ncbi:MULTISPECIES: FKBP-type peptidyl-prolyl cis-trans isomerase N-terminal domain-containing protein [unclassified Serratia (in: enterobacteria)]|uniref:FKBP-type peptidyl-prolyl cis-trans isomerase N-terminal domain-containing protein n=1 Tax=unclassified Serratia (in: enterobacteria) TaxID=2647522 RepID=UPI002ED69985|nr:FKBP-type peptidyl-prolyl cis-trans isomerase N-terminal domain-containing protein [Serratia sp. C2(2)]MEE4445965.1 FKBP-type peptidyl-prolyl cis-trans isomerase N-terminal domain-containing protein [Serratia sp. C2(1)]